MPPQFRKQEQRFGIAETPKPALVSALAGAADLGGAE